jgi:hypothetical protein
MKHTPPTFLCTSRLRLRDLIATWAILVAVFTALAFLIVGGAACSQEKTTGPAVIPFGQSQVHGTTQPTPTSQAIEDPLTLVNFDSQEQNMPGFSEWLDLLRAKFPDGAVVICGHGGMLAGQWCVFPTPGIFDMTPLFSECPVPLEWLTTVLRIENPMEPIVCLDCNPDHQVLHIPNVYYAMDSIWIVPDVDMDPLDRYIRHLAEPGVVGDLSGFVHTPGVK